MSESRIRTRPEIPAQYKWNAESVFASDEAWDAEAKSVLAMLPEVQAFQGHLVEGPGKVADAMDAFDALIRRVGKVYVYANMAHEVDTTDPHGTRMYSQVLGLQGQALGAAAFIDPELIAIGEPTLRQWLAQEPRLAAYGHYIDNVFRQQAHVRSAEVEELLGLLSDPFLATATTASQLTDADFTFPNARTSDGRDLPVAQANFDEILAGPDREARRTAWEGYQDTYLAHKNALAANLATAVKQNIFNMRARRFSSTLEMSLFNNNIPTAVFTNLIETFRKNLPTWRRYWQVRRKALGVDTLHPYDVWAPLVSDKPRVEYAQAVDWIGAGLAPLGEDYVRVLRRGCLEDRWVDVYPNQGKFSGAFSSGWPGTHPFIVMSYDNTLFSLSTLAHELGHSMHSYLAWQRHPAVYSQYSLFVAEVASNFHQAMTRAHLLKANPGRDFQISLIEEAMSNFHRYFFIMPTLARFELEIHQRVERGQGLTADDLNSLMADLWAEGYGSEMQLDRQRDGITWATFGHLYSDYYVYQYATGISAAHTLSHRILNGAPNAAQDYVRFLSAGGSVYPLEALKLAGVDMTSPNVVEDTFAVLGSMVDRLETLVTQ